MTSKFSMLAFIVATLTAANASAYERVFSGNSCEPLTSASAASIGRHPTLGLYNSSTTTSISVICPIEVPDVLAKSPIRAGANVWDHNATAGQDVRCTFYSWTGSTWWQGNQSINGVSGSMISGFFWDPVVQAASPSPMSIVCTLPPSTSAGVSSLVNYWFYD